MQLRWETGSLVPGGGSSKLGVTNGGNRPYEDKTGRKQRMRQGSRWVYLVLFVFEDKRE